MEKKLKKPYVYDGLYSLNITVSIRLKKRPIDLVRRHIQQKFYLRLISTYLSGNYYLSSSAKYRDYGDYVVMPYLH